MSMTYSLGPIEQQLLSPEYWEGPVIDPVKENGDSKQQLEYALNTWDIMKGKRDFAGEIGNIILSLEGGASIHPGLEIGDEIPLFGEDEPRKVVRAVVDSQHVVSRRWRMEDLKKMKPGSMRVAYATMKADRAACIYVKYNVDERREHAMNQDESYSFESLASAILSPDVISMIEPYTYKEEGSLFTYVNRGIRYIRAGIGNQGASLSPCAVRNNELANDRTATPIGFPAVKVGDVYSTREASTYKIVAANVIEAHGIRWTHDLSKQPPSPPQSEKRSVFGWNPGFNLSTG